MIHTVIYDMDGTLVDSEGAIAQAAKEALVDWGVYCELPEFLPFTGLGDDLFIGGVAESHGVAYTAEMKRRAYEIYCATAKARVKVFPWSRPLIEGLKQRGLRSAVASAADRIRVEQNLACIGFGIDSFDAVIAADDVTKQKPDPEVFVKTMSAIGAVPTETLVFEDTLAGVKSAKTAGAYCIAVTTSYPRAELVKAGADAALDDLSDLFGILKIFDTGV